jgi:hypothetical protein
MPWSLLGSAAAWKLVQPPARSRPSHRPTAATTDQTRRDALKRCTIGGPALEEVEFVTLER